MKQDAKTDSENRNLSTQTSKCQNTIMPGLDTKNFNLWFEEKDGLGLHSGFKAKIKTVLTRFRSEFQDIAVMETEGLGRMLVLDGVIQLTESDESGYQEMITHVPLISHPNPKNVLVIGGGDGGAVREIIKHKCVQKVILCEIDPEVIRVSKEYLPGLAKGLNDPRVEIINMDGAAFARNHPDDFDVIIIDSTDPFGPAETLFQQPFYEDIKLALTEKGIVVCQAESFMWHPAIVKYMTGFMVNLFPVTAYYYTIVPTYPSGIIGFCFCSKGSLPNNIDEKRISELTDLEYYNVNIHKGSFMLPARALDLLPEKAWNFHI